MKVSQVLDIHDEDTIPAFNRDMINAIVGYYKEGRITYDMALKQLCNHKGLSIEQAKQMLAVP